MRHDGASERQRIGSTDLTQLRKEQAKSVVAWPKMTTIEMNDEIDDVMIKRS